MNQDVLNNKVLKFLYEIKVNKNIFKFDRKVITVKEFNL